MWFRGGSDQQGQLKQGKEIMTVGLTKSRSTPPCSTPHLLSWGTSLAKSEEGELDYFSPTFYYEQC